jgi:hypothetical protein
MALPRDLANVLLHMWLGAMPLVAGALALVALQLWPRARAALARRRRRAWQAMMRARLSRAHFATAAVVALRGATSADGGVRARLLLAVQGVDGEYPAAAEWLVAPEALAQLQPGQMIDVLVLAGRPRRVLPNVAWLSGAGSREPGAAGRELAVGG